MKYYTPELLARFASDDEKIALAAQDELEQRAEQYAEYLKSIAKKLPPRFRELPERYYLHDAQVAWPFFPWFAADMGPLHPEMLWDMFEDRAFDRSGGVPSFVIALQLDAPPKELLVLHYRGVRFDGPPFRPRWHPRFPFLEWRHDEVELVAADREVEFLHDVLFSEGVELRLRFTDFDFATLKPMTTTPARTTSRGRMTS